jgi:DNA repair photolyase
MPKCGSQTTLCDVPIRFDTYHGCSHFCKYCFAQHKIDLKNISTFESEKALRNFISGHRERETAWCDWDIPIHWGGVSDPFQPIEKKFGVSLRCLKVFAETKYPFIVSTKGKLIIEDEYLDVLKQCNCVIQISIVSPKLNSIEKGAPDYFERIKMINKLSTIGKRIIVRVQPYFPDVKEDVLKAVQVYKELGVYGMILEGMKYKRSIPGMVKIGADFCYPYKTLHSDFTEIKAKAHEYGLKFYSGENRLRNMGDDLCCCGIDGLEGFKGNKANFNHFLFDEENFAYTEKMKEEGTAYFAKSIDQTTKAEQVLKSKSYEDVMNAFCNSSSYLSVMFPEKQ